MLEDLDQKLAQLNQGLQQLLKVQQLNREAVRLAGERRQEQALAAAIEACDLARRDLGETHPERGISLNNLAQLYCQAGNYAAAEPLCRELLEIQRKAVGEAHPDFAASLNGLGMIYYQAGNDAAAEPLYRQALEIRRKALGDTHRDVADTLHNLAVLYQTAGNYAAAEPLYRQELEITRKVLGEEHPQFAEVLHYLAMLYGAVGEYAAAEPLFRQSLEIRRKVLGAEHPQVAGSLNDLAMLYYRAGNYPAAEPLYRQALEIRRKALGEAHPQFATSLNNLAVLYRTMGNYAAAEPLCCQALEIYRKALGEEHPDFATALDNLAAVYWSVGNYAAAEPLYRQALEIRRDARGEEHPDVAYSLNNLAELHRSMGNYAAAEPLYREALHIFRKAMGEDHPSVAGILNNLAMLYDSLGNYTEAEALSQQALEIRRKALGENHPQFADSLHNLATLYLSLGNYSAAEPLYRQALEITRKALGEEHPNVADSVNNLAAVYKARGDYAAAEPLYLYALEIRRKALGDEHPDVANSLNSLAALYRSMGNYAAAAPLYQEARDIVRKRFGEEHPHLAVILNNLALLDESTGNYAAAEPLYRQALEITRKALGDEHPELVTSMNNLAVLYVATRRENEGLALMRQASAIEDRIIGQVFAISSENQRLAYIGGIQKHVDAFLSLVSGYRADRPDAVRAALDLVLRRKAIGAEALAAQRDAVLGGKYPALAPILQDLTSLRMQIAQKSLAGPGAEGVEAHRKQLTEWNARKEQLEADLARQIPEMKVEQRLRAAEHNAVALALPEGAALLEFVRFEVFDFKAVRARGESQWKPARYVAFILTASEPDNVHMIDLGEAEAIDEMIARFRRGITGEAETRGGQNAEARRIPEWKGSQGLELRATVFDRVVAALRGRKRLLVAPDGDLTRLPFEALPTDDGRRLIDEYHISYLGAGRDVLRFRVGRSGVAQEPLVIADPDLDLGGKAVIGAAVGGAEVTRGVPKSKGRFWSRLMTRERGTPEPQTAPTAQTARVGGPAGRLSRDFDLRALHFEQLPGTRVEGERIAGMLGVRPWLGTAALEAWLKACRSPRILHLATHGFFLPDQTRDHKEERGRALNSFGAASGDDWNRMPVAELENPLLRSGLALAGANTWCRGGSLPAAAEDGLLTAEDVSGLNLLDTELVVLSACETGLGEVRTGEGVFGLRRAFVLAGAKGLVMSLWKVPDEETRKLMEDFYARMLKQQPGQSRSAALRAAQLAMKENEDYRDPLYWGAFIYEGDPGFTS